jgi:predicted DNA-binding transcriptional regulator AlpA
MKSTNSTTGVGSGASSPSGSRDLNPGRPHDPLLEAATCQAKTAALTTPCHFPEQAHPTPITARGPPDQLRAWLLSDRQVGKLLNISRASVWRHAAGGKIPKPVKIGGLTRWVASEVEAVVQRAMAERGGTPDAPEEGQSARPRPAACPHFRPA